MDKLILDNYKKLLKAIEKSDIEQLKKHLNKENLNGIVHKGKFYLNKTPLYWSFEWKDKKLFRYLLDYGSDPNINIGSINLLHNSIWEEAFEFYQEFEDELTIDFTKLLIEYGAEINSFDGNQMTPLDVAIDQNHTLAVDFLRSLGAKRNPLSLFVR